MLLIILITSIESIDVHRRNIFKYHNSNNTSVNSEMTRSIMIDP